MSDKINRPSRVSFEVTPSQKRALNGLIPWGLAAPFWRAIVDDVITALQDEDNRDKVISLVMSGRLKLTDWSKVFDNNG